MSDLKRRMAKGAAWMVLFRFVERGIGLISTLILARLLVPADFGLIAMAMTIIAALELLGAYSFETSLIQNQQAGRAHYDTAFTLNLALALLKAILIVALAWPAAEFYEEARLVPVMLALAATVAVQGVENIGIVNFQKNLDFHKEFLLGLYRRLAGFVATLIVAWWLQSYWALIVGITVTRLVSVALSYTMSDYRPRLCVARARELFSYSKWLLLNNILIFLNNRGADFVIGRVSGAHALGLYSVSFELANLPTTELVHPIQRAIFPGYSRLAADLGALRQAFLEVIGLMAVLTLPVGLLIGVLSQQLVLAMLGARWLEAVPLIEVLAVFGIIRALHGPTGSIYLALGRPRLLALFSVVQLVVAVGLMVVWVPEKGALGAAWSILVGAALAMLTNFGLVVRSLAISPALLLGVLWRPMSAALMMMALVSTLTQACGSGSSSLSAWVQLLGFGLMGVMLYVLILLGLWILSGRPNGTETLLIGEVRTRLEWRSNPSDA